MFIPDPGSNGYNKRGGGKIVVLPLLGQLIKNYSTFYPKKIVTKLSEIWVGDPGSGKNLSRILGSKRQRDPGSGSATLPTLQQFIFDT
jgi:hypothetical protein